MTYTVIRSDRKTLALQIKGGKLIVRAPYGVSPMYVENFVREHMDWVNKQMARVEANRKTVMDLPPLGKEELLRLAQEAARVIPERVRYWAERMGVTYGRVTIRNQKTRWGSCNAKGDLNFNCLLMLAPPEVLDSVVVHELCHRKEMNHSERFYREVLAVFPEYHRWHPWLKQHGGKLLVRMEKGKQG